MNGFDEVLPAGAYCVETDEEPLEGISFPAYRRILTLIHLHPKPGHPGRRQTLAIDPKELEAALKRDQAPPRMPADAAVRVWTELFAQRMGQEVDAGSSLRLEPDLDEVMSDPIVHLVMRRDGLVEAAIWGAIRTARTHLAARSGQEALKGIAEGRREEADRQAIERGENEGMMVHPGRTTNPQYRGIRIFPKLGLRPLPLIEAEVQSRRSINAATVAAKKRQPVAQVRKR